MNIPQFLVELEDLIPKSILSDEFGKPPFLSGSTLKHPLLLERILDLDEFEFCELEILDNPTAKCKTMLLQEGIKFRQSLKLYSIYITPAVYHPKEILTPIKDNSAVTPLVYDPTDFIPYKSIVMRYSPEFKQDQIKMTNKEREAQFKEEMHKRLDDILNNPEQYQSKGHYGVLLRGEITKYDFPDNSDKMEVRFK